MFVERREIIGFSGVFCRLFNKRSQSIHMDIMYVKYNEHSQSFNDFNILYETFSDF